MVGAIDWKITRFLFLFSAFKSVCNENDRYECSLAELFREWISSVKLLYAIDDHCW